MSVVAQEVTVRIQCSPGVRPIRVLGREVDITGQTVTAYLNQVYGEQEKYVLLEVEVPAGEAGPSRGLAQVAVSYVNMASNRPRPDHALRFVQAQRTRRRRWKPVPIAR